MWVQIPVGSSPILRPSDRLVRPCKQIHCRASVNRAETTVGWSPGQLCLSNLDNMKIKCSYETVINLADCSECGETNLSTKYGDQDTEAGPVCYLCHQRLTATEQREGARPSEAR